MKLYSLGCNGWIPTDNQTCCFMLEIKNNLIILDAGTGIANLKSYRDVLDKYSSISVILSHYHLDHTIGLSFLLPYIQNKELIIYGPGLPIYSHSTEEYVKQLLQPDFFAAELEKSAKKIRFIDYGGDDFKVNNLNIKVKLQKHSSPSFRISIENNVIYSTDTILDSKDWTDIDGSSILLHECWAIKDNFNEQPQHSSLDAIFQYINRNKFREIVLIHQNPFWTDVERKSIRQMIKGTNISLGVDNTIINIEDY